MKFNLNDDKKNVDRLKKIEASIKDISLDQFVQFEIDLFLGIFDKREWRLPLNVVSLTKEIINQIFNKLKKNKFDFDNNNIKDRLISSIQNDTYSNEKTSLISSILSSIDFKNYDTVNNQTSILINDKYINEYLDLIPKDSKTFTNPIKKAIHDQGVNLSLRDTFKWHEDTIKKHYEYDSESLEIYKQAIENEDFVREYNDLKPDINIIEMLERYKHSHVNTLNPELDFNTTPMIQAQLGLNADNFRGLQILKRAEDLHVKNIKEIFELYIMRRHPKVKDILEQVGMNPEELELRYLPTSQLIFVEDLLLKTKDASLSHLMDQARMFYDLVKGKIIYNINN